VRLASWIYRWWNNRDMEQWFFSLFLGLDSVLTFRMDASASSEITHEYIVSLKWERMIKSASLRANMLMIRKHDIISTHITGVSFDQIPHGLSAIMKKLQQTVNLLRSDFQQVDVSDKEYRSLQNVLSFKATRVPLHFRKRQFEMMREREKGRREMKTGRKRSRVLVPRFALMFKRDGYKEKSIGAKVRLLPSERACLAWLNLEQSPPPNFYWPISPAAVDARGSCCSAG